MFKVLSYACFVCGLLIISGWLMFPLGILFANLGARSGEDTALSGTLNLIGVIVMAVFTIILLLFL